MILPLSCQVNWRIGRFLKNQKLLLDFSLVVNHDHLYLLPNIENGIPIFIGRLNNGFAQYYNLKYHRKGTLFDGPYRAVITKNQFQADFNFRSDDIYYILACSNL